MAYQRQAWENNKTVVKAEHFEHIESGIIEVQGSAANALKGTILVTAASGQCELKDASPLAHTAFVKARSKNLFNLNATPKGAADYFEKISDSDFRLTAALDDAETTVHWILPVDNPEKLVGQEMTMWLGSLEGGPSSVQLAWGSDSGIQSFISLSFPQTAESAVIPSMPHSDCVLCVIASVSTGSTTFGNVQVELGAAKTAYTPYVEFFAGRSFSVTQDETYTTQYYLSEEGSCEFQVATPATVVCLGEEPCDIVLECEYNLDINKALEACANTGITKEELVDAVLAALPNGDEVRY